MRNKDNYTNIAIKKSYKELFYKIITSIFIRGLLLLIPVFWSNTVNYLSEGDFQKTYSLIIVIVVLSAFYYIWQYLNQVSWFKFYDKLSFEYTSLIIPNTNSFMLDGTIFAITSNNVCWSIFVY